MNKLLLAVTTLALAACQPFEFHPDGSDGGTGGGGGGASTGGGGGSSTGGGAGGGGVSTYDGGSVTWYRDVLPIARDKCQVCHQTGGIAPFSLETYATAAPFAASMAADVRIGKMPPWMPSASCGPSYVGDLRLSPTQVDVINAWAQQNAPEGDPNDAPPASDAGVGQLAWVDQTVAPAQAYTPNASLSDDYHCSVIDPQLVSSRYVIGYQVLPDVRAEVHHVILYAVSRADAQAKDPSGTGWTCFGGSGINDEIFVGGWAPGSGAVEFPAGTGINVPADHVYVMQVHYNLANGVDAPDRTAMQLQYANTPVTPATVGPVADYLFSVPPNAMNFTPGNEPKMTANPYGVPVKVWGVFPHMHTHGRRITVTGPQGCYIDIPNWDFHWQQQYFFGEPFTVQPNEQVGLTCTWDNPTASPLRWGEGTADEMCIAFLYMTQ